MCELTGDKMTTATSEPREWWIVRGNKDKDTEFFPSLDLAKALAAINNFKYPCLGPYRVLRVVEVVDCDPKADEQDEREGRGERMAEEAERRARAESDDPAAPRSFIWNSNGSICEKIPAASPACPERTP